MSRGLLDNPTLQSISENLPVIDDLQQTTLSLSPDFISINYKPNSTIPNAAICLQDTVNTLSEARYAFHEVIAHKVWYLEKAESKNEAAAIYFSKFYVDDIALRLYSSAEHLAESIKDMLEISNQELKPFEKKRTSRQAILGNFLRKEKATHNLTIAVIQLADTEEWQKTIKYRDEWVHSQPPLVKGLGIVYKRGQRWNISNNSVYTLGVGNGDEPEFSVEDLLKFIQPALFKFTDTVRTVTQFYTNLLKN